MTDTPHTYTTDIIISGGGIGGLTAALLLGKSGFHVHIIDPAFPPPREHIKPCGRTVALMNASINILKATDIWDVIAPLAAPLKTMRLVDNSLHDKDQDSIETDFPAYELSLEQFGYNIPNAPLRAALYQKAQTLSCITMHADTLDTLHVSHHSVAATLSRGTTIHATLLIGADGRKSKVRQLHNIPTQTKPYNQSAITCLINHSRSHNYTSTEFHRPGGPLALVPLPGNQSSVVWVEKTAQADALMAYSPQEFVQALEEATGHILGGLTLESQPQSWPLCAIKTKTLIAPRTALIAEAAHVMSPITAQGLNLSLRDVATLAEILVDSRRKGLDIGTMRILQSYEKRRQLDINTRTRGVDTMNTLVAQDGPLIKKTRRFGLRMMDRLTPLRTTAMHIGLAPTIDQSRLARGQGL